MIAISAAVLRQDQADTQQRERSLLDQRIDAIEKATPDWVRRCRGLNHNVALVSADMQADGSALCAWFCTCCGKDRA